MAIVTRKIKIAFQKVAHDITVLRKFYNQMVEYVNAIVKNHNMVVIEINKLKEKQKELETEISYLKGRNYHFNEASTKI